VTEREARDWAVKHLPHTVRQVAVLAQTVQGVRRCFVGEHAEGPLGTGFRWWGRGTTWQAACDDAQRWMDAMGQKGGSWWSIFQGWTHTGEAAAPAKRRPRPGKRRRAS
jgi:hypothetical protein